MENKDYFVSVVIPSFNEEKSIGDIIQKVILVLNSQHFKYEVILVDDGSTDCTGEKGKNAGAKVITHPYNIGNGAAIKTGVREAKGDVIVILDGDGQHNPDDIPRLLEYYPMYQLIVGSRNQKSEIELHRKIANKIYNILASYVVDKRVEDLTSGFRAIDARVLRKILYLLPNGFSAPSTSTIAIFRSGYAVKYVSVCMGAREGKSKINLIKDGLRFLFIIIRIGVFFNPSRIFLPLSLFIFLPGFVYAIYRLFIGMPWTIPIMISLTGGLIIFTIGLISEQTALLRMSQTE